MKIKFRSLLIVGGLLALAGPVHAQTPSPTPPPVVGSVYLDNTQSNAARLADAAAVLATHPTDPTALESATYVFDLLTLDPATNWASVSSLAEGLLASQGMYVATASAGHASVVYDSALRAKLRLAFTTPAARTAYLAPLLSALTSNSPDYVGMRLRHRYAGEMNAQVIAQLQAGQNDAALNFALDPILLADPSNCTGDVLNILRLKTRTRAADTLAWAKLAYLTSPFGDKTTPAVIMAAFKAVDMTLGRSNAFAQSQTDTTVVNPLTAIGVPPAYQAGGLPEPKFHAVNLLLQGSTVPALAWSRDQYVSASDNSNINAALGTLAQTLRNVDGNSVRANSCVAAQGTSTPFVITELQGQ